MELIPIRLILDNSGNLLNDYTLLPVVNQYATNYELQVAFLNGMPSARLIKAIFTINGKASPARVLSPSLKRLKLAEGVYSYFSNNYQLTQYETQFYQDELRIDIFVYDDTSRQIMSTNVKLAMVKQQFNKLTPANLDEDQGSLSSVTKAIYDLRQDLLDTGITGNEDFESKTDALAKLEEAKDYTERKVSDLNDAIIKNYSTIAYVDQEIQRSSIDDKIFASSKIVSAIEDHNASPSAHQDIRISLIDHISSLKLSYIPTYYYNKDAIDSKIYGISSSLENYGTKSYITDYVRNQISELVGSAPGALDTLKELSAALGNDPNFSENILYELGQKVGREEFNSSIDTTAGIANSANLIAKTVQGELNALKDSIISVDTLSKVARTGLYTDLLGIPDLSRKQDLLVSGANIVTINGKSLLSSGNITITPGVDSYNDLKDKPRFISDASATANRLKLIFNSGDNIEFVAITDFNDLLNKPTRLSNFINDLDIPDSNFVREEIAKLVDSSPAALDTLKELATALGNDPNFSTTITNQLASKVSKVDYETKVASIEARVGADEVKVAKLEKDILNKIDTSDVATVGKTGSYNDLKDKPTLAVLRIWGD